MAPLDSGACPSPFSKPNAVPRSRLHVALRTMVSGDGDGLKGRYDTLVRRLITNQKCELWRNEAEGHADPFPDGAVPYNLCALSALVPSWMKPAFELVCS